MDPDILIATIREGGATGASGGERLPSLFEVLLVGQIDGMVRPAVLHGFRSLCDGAPAASLPLLAAFRTRSDELCRLLVMAAQWACVRAHGASISETLYGLSWRSVLGDGSVARGCEGATEGAGRGLRVATTEPLRPWQRDLSVFLVAVMPLLLEALQQASRQLRALVARRHRRRLEQEQEREERERELAHAHAQAQAAEAHAESQSVPRQVQVPPGLRLLRAAAYMANTVDRALGAAAELSAHAFPYLQGTAGLAVVVQRFRYLCGDSVFAHPLLALASVALVRRDTGLHAEASPGLVAAALAGTGSTGERRVSLAPKSGQSQGAAVAAGGAAAWRTAAIVGAVVAMRGLQWYLRNREAHSNMSQRVRLAAAAASSVAGTSAARGGAWGMHMVPPPPEPLRSDTPSPASDSCPLCSRPHRSPCVSAGGYVFCHACLLQRLRADAGAGLQPACPVSGLPCAEEEVICVH